VIAPKSYAVATGSSMLKMREARDAGEAFEPMSLVPRQPAAPLLSHG
jgi:hypothetical protein